MAEYVCELPIDGMVSFVSGTTTIPVRERIVRCKNCKHMFAWSCDSLFCMSQANVVNGSLGAVCFPRVKPEHFCSYGEPKEDEDG